MVFLIEQKRDRRSIGVGYIKETGVNLGTRMEPFNGKSVEVDYYNSNILGVNYHYYETKSGQFVSADKDRLQ